LIESKIPKISSSKIVQIEFEMMGGGHKGKNSYQSRSSSSSSMFNGDVKVLECWCPIICAVRKEFFLYHATVFY
jgi:hypothetical protein